VSRTFSIFKRELASYFRAPLSYVFVAAFVLTSGILTFFVGQFFERGQADLQPFFAFHPWLYPVLAAALSMRLWAEERRTGTIELLMTLPIRLGEAVLGKFLAAWFFAGFALSLTLPLWLTANFLGNPDNNVILAGYGGSWVMAGAMLAMGAAISATTGNQTLAFVATAGIAFLMTAIGSSAALGLLRGWAPDGFVEIIAASSIPSHFTAIMLGVLDVRDLVYFGSAIIAFLVANAIVIDLKRIG
jgi:ABC-2 type transport system permease protein